MKDLIKEVALSVWASQENAADTRSGDQIVTEFATAFLAELSKRAEAVAYIDRRSFEYHVDNSLETSLSVWRGSDGAKCNIHGSAPMFLFTLPPIHDIEAIENRVAEACAKACIKEAVQIVIDGPEERAYNNATSDCAEAIRSGEWRKYK